MARERGYVVDIAGFEAALDQQRRRSQEERKAKRVGVALDAKKLKGTAQPADVAAYNVVPTAIGEDHLAFAGRNDAGRCMSFPDGRPSTWSMPSLVIT